MHAQMLIILAVAVLFLICVIPLSKGWVLKRKDPASDDMRLDHFWFAKKGKPMVHMRVLFDLAHHEEFCINRERNI